VDYREEDPGPAGPSEVLDEPAHEPPREERAEPEEVEEQPEEGDDMDMGAFEENEDDEIALLLVTQFGGSGRGYVRERKQSYRRIVSELYSPPRVAAMTKMLPSLKLLPGVSFDLTTLDPEDGQPWDFTRLDKRQRCREIIREQKPILVVGSPECRAYCSWQALNEAKDSTGKIAREKVAAGLHLRFCCEIYEMQANEGRYFLHEHPMNATSWQENSVQNMLKRPDVATSIAHQCQYGLQAPEGRYEGEPVFKPTRFMSNGAHILARLSRQCTGRAGQCSRPEGGKHVHIEGTKISKHCQRYPRALCKAILVGLHDQLRHDHRIESGMIGILPHDEVFEEVCSLDDGQTETARGAKGMMGEGETLSLGCSGRYRDAITGQPLIDTLIHEARQKELKYFEDKLVWKRRPRSEARQRTGKAPISVRWVDVNKGDDIHPNYRSRLVARQIKALDRSGDTYFAPAPPNEAVRFAISSAATDFGSGRTPVRDPASEQRMQLSFVDICRAYFNAPTDPNEPTYVDLPEEVDPLREMCGLLLRHMYGTRKAADGWQEEYSSLLVSRLGFTQGTASPCVFVNKERNITCAVHGDDFTSSGPKSELDWFDSALAEH